MSEHPNWAERLLDLVLVALIVLNGLAVTANMIEGDWWGAMDAAPPPFLLIWILVLRRDLRRAERGWAMVSVALRALIDALCGPVRPASTETDADEGAGAKGPQIEETGRA